MTNSNQLKKNTEIENEVDSVSLIDLLLILAKHKRKIIILPFIFGLLGFLASLALPNIYRANTKILPPQQSQSSASTMLSQLSGLSGGSLGIKNPNDLYIALLKSRTLTDKLIQRFDLKTRYNQIYLEGARSQLASRSTITTGKDNIISIDVDDKDPKVAAEIANAYTEELSSLTSKFALTEASQRRIFYEEQLELVKNRMIEAESKLATNISNSGLQSVDTQSKAVLETAAKLRANISEKEIHIKSMQAFVTPNSRQYKIAFQELLEMKAELTKLESGSEIFSKAEAQTERSISSKKSLQSGSSNFQTLRDVRYHQMLYEMLAKQYEIARLDEAKDLPMIQVLDPATEPEKKLKPQKSLISFASFTLGLISVLIFVFLSESIKHSKSEEVNKKILELKDILIKF